MTREEKTKTDPPAPDEVLDLRGVPCPLSWAKARVRLDALGPGRSLILVLDDPRGVRDIPRAAEAQGYAVDLPGASAAPWRLRITT